MYLKEVEITTQKKSLPFIRRETIHRATREFLSPAYPKMLELELTKTSQQDDALKHHREIHSILQRTLINKNSVDSSRNKSHGDTIISSSEVCASKILDSHNVKYRRQELIGPVLVDFYVPDYGLIIEIDGLMHTKELKSKKDQAIRDALAKAGFWTLPIETRNLKVDLLRIINQLKVSQRLTGKNLKEKEARLYATSRILFTQTINQIDQTHSKGDTHEESQMPRLRALSLFSGIGGDTLGLKDYCETIAYCEKSTFKQDVLKKAMRNGDIPKGEIFPDIKNLTGKNAPKQIDIIYGGSPCQQLSNNNPMGKGLEGKDSALFYELMRIIGETRPKFVFLENVEGLIKKALPEISRLFSETGYNFEWITIPATSVGAHHARKRWFMLAISNPNSNRCNGRLSDISARSIPEAKISMEKNQQTRDGGKSKSRATSPTRRKEWRINANTYTWEAEPSMARVANGLSNQLDRIRSLGDAVVPAQAKLAFEILMGIKTPQANNTKDKHAS